MWMRPDNVKKMNLIESDRWLLLKLEFGAQKFPRVQLQGNWTAGCVDVSGQIKEVRLEGILRVQSSRSERSALGRLLEQA